MKAVNHWADRGGNRVCLVLKTGRKWARLLDIGSLEIHRAPIDTVERAALVEIRPARLARRLDERRRQYKRLHLRHPARDIKAAVAALRGGSP